MAYTKTTWAVTTRVSAHSLNHLETQYDEVMSTETTWNNHDSRYYTKTEAIVKFFNASFMGKGSSADADLLDGHHASDLIGTGLPVGSIVWWTNSEVSIPTGWYVCNGANGTADYRDRFVVGASSTLTLKSLYGAATVTPTSSSVTIGDTTLDTTQIAAHTHGWTEYHNIRQSVSAYIYYYGYDYTTYYYVTGDPTLRATGNTGSGGSHTHTGSTVTWNSESNLPPYCALYLIQRKA